MHSTPRRCWEPLLFVWGGTLYAFYSQGVALMGEEFPAADLSPREYGIRDGLLPGGRGRDRALGGIAMDAWPSTGLPVMLSCAPLLLLVGLLQRRAARAVR